MVSRSAQSGFSLVELSIVLVILGLLTGGILAGQSLIRAAELRSVTADFSRYNAAFRTFQDKYFAIPGDMTNATAFWGFAAGTIGNDATCFNASQTGQGTCNGNGNGDLTTLLTASASNPLGETFHAWKQLASAGLIEGTYTGFPGPNGNFHAVPGTNVPRGRLSSTGYTLWSLPAGPSDANWFPAKAGPMFIFGASLTTVSEAPALRPEESWNLDTKLYDGKPAIGNVITYKQVSLVTPNCTDTTDPATANYALNNSAIACNLQSHLY